MKLLMVIVLAVMAGAANAQSFNQNLFMNDPYLPFSDYDSRDQLMDDFKGSPSRLAEDYELTDDPELKKIAAQMVDQAYGAFKKIYPKFMANKAKPPFVVATSDEALDATAVQPYTRSDNHMGFIIFTRGFLKSSESYAAKLGTVAHEMAHLFFWHQNGNVTPIRVYYAGGKPISVPEVMAFSNWLLLSDVMGLADIEEFNGITVDSVAGRAASELINKMYEIKNPLCGEKLGKGLLVHLGEMRAEAWSPLLWDFYLNSPLKRKRVEELAKKIISLVNGCLKTQPAEFNRLSIGQYSTNIMRHVGVELPTTNISFDEFLTLTRGANARLHALAKEFDQANLRYYSVEDQADLAGAAVLKHLGLPITAPTEHFLKVLGGTDEKACRQMLKAGQEPPYGTLKDNHHSPCWRVYNIKVNGAAGVPGLE